MLRLLPQEPGSEASRPIGFQDAATFSRTIELERVRSDRTEVPIALVAFFIKPQERAELIARIQLRARQTDHMGVLGGDQVGAVLWNCRERGARQFISVVADGLSSADYELFLYPTAPPASDADHSASRLVFDDVVIESPSESDPGTDRDTVDRSEFSSAEYNPSEASPSEDHQLDDAFDFGSDRSGQLCQKSRIEFANHAKPWPVTDSMTHWGNESSPGLAQAGTMLLQPANVTIKEMMLAEPLLDTMDRLDSLVEQELATDVVHREARPLEELFLQPLPKWKRCIDVVGATVGLIVLSPLLLLSALLIKITAPGPVLFRQTREGLGGRLFTIYKFRTMFVDADKRKDELRTASEQDGPCFKMAGDPRITPLGRYLRKTCIDELPQLWNVLKGDMTLVGPRPLDYRESQKIHQWGRRRLEATPGLTCIWQVHGKSRVPFNEWMRMDIRYMRKRGFWLDLKLIRETVQQVLLHRASH